MDVFVSHLRFKLVRRTWWGCPAVSVVLRVHVLMRRASSSLGRDGNISVAIGMVGFGLVSMKVMAPVTVMVGGALGYAAYLLGHAKMP